MYSLLGWIFLYFIQRRDTLGLENSKPSSSEISTTFMHSGSFYSGTSDTNGEFFCFGMVGSTSLFKDLLIILFPLLLYILCLLLFHDDNMGGTTTFTRDM
jgi:hypothetical protein